MWIASLLTDPRRSCFITVPQKWGINFSQLPTIKIQQSSKDSTTTVYATCIAENGLKENENVVIGSNFSRINGLLPDQETVFENVVQDIPVLSSLIAEPCLEQDWELLEMNVDQIQSELLSRIRVVWVGAKIPIWLSDFVSLSVRIVEIDPRVTVGLLANDTEIHISPPTPKAHVGPVTNHEKPSLKSIFANLLTQHLPKAPTEDSKHISHLELRVLPLEGNEMFHKLVMESSPDAIIQPYSAFLSDVHQQTFPDFKNCIGSIQHAERTSYFSVNFIKSSSSFPIFSNTIYLTEVLIRQLKLHIKQRYEVLVENDFPSTQCESLSFFTFVQDYDLKEFEKDTKMWLQSVVGNEAKLVLNHGQHIDIPCFLKGKTNRLFIGIQSKSSTATFCRIDDISLTKVLAKLKIIRIRLNNAPQYLQLIDDVQTLPRTIVSVGGVANLLETAVGFLKTGFGLFDNNLCNACTGCRHGNMLLTGPRGSGRTSIAQKISSLLEDAPSYVHTVFIDCASLKGKRVETLQRDWSLIFQKLTECEPSLLILDDLDLLAGSSDNNQDDNINGEAWYYKRIATMILELVKGTSFLNQTMILATAVSEKSLHPTLNNFESSHLFTYHLSIPPLTNEMREDILEKLLESSPFKIDENLNFSGVVSKMDGFVAADIRHLVDKAIHLAASEAGCLSSAVLKIDHVVQALEGYVPAGLHGIQLKPPTDSRIGWEDVGGLDQPKKLLIEILKWPTQYPELFSNCPIRLRSALLLYGAPGTGKTMLARAVATECQVNFISIKGPELLSKYIGASEESVRETFRRARSAKPCILFFDEFDSLAPRRGHDSTGVTDRVVNQLLTELDGVEGQEAGLWVLAATSRPDLIDPALLRPGRFDVSVRCPLPGKDERLDILKALSSKLHLNDDVRLEEIAIEAEHYSGADLQAVLYTAQLKAVHELAKGEKPTAMRITHQLLVNALRETRPSVTASERQRYDRIYEKFDSGDNVERHEGSPGPARVTLA